MLYYSKGGMFLDVSTISTLIGTLGFPIVCTIALFYYIMKKDEAHKEEISKLAEAVMNNTAVMQKFLDKIEKI